MVTTLYVGNLPWSTTEQDLANWVSPYATVRAARVIVDRETGRSRGFGFVEVPTEQVPQVITALHETTLGGRVVSVNEAQARPR